MMMDWEGGRSGERGCPGLVFALFDRLIVDIDVLTVQI